MRQMAEAINAALPAWWAKEYPDARDGYDAVLLPLAPEYVHLSLGWVDQPFDAAGAELDSLTEVLKKRLVEIEPFKVRVGPVHALEMALNFFVEPDPRLGQLAATVRAGRPGGLWRCSSAPG